MRGLPIVAMMPPLDLILGRGGAINEGSPPGQSLLLLLDAIQPVGILPILLDQNNLLPSLGAAASRSHFLPVQVIEFRRVHRPGYGCLGHCLGEFW